MKTDHDSTPPTMPALPDGDVPPLTLSPSASYEPAFPMSALRESPTNPRKHYGDLDELAQSIRASGILSPLLVRPRDDHHEIVFGHRRFRAAARAGLSEIPVTVRDMSDREVIEAQIIENAQRSDIHPMEEAEGFQRLHAEHGYSAEDLAAKVGKSASYVYGRIRLCALCSEARELFAAGRFQLAVALTLAQVTDPTLQAAAAKEVSEPRWAGHVWTTADARRHIVHSYMLRLVDAPFDPADAALIPAAGACTTCPKNTGRELALFPNEKAEAMCTDRVCFDVKRDAGWALRKAGAEDRGERVLSDEEVTEIWPSGRFYSYRGPYLSLDETCFEDPKRRVYRDLLTGQIPLVIARVDGTVYELIEKKLIPKLLKAAGHDFEKLRAEMAREAAEKAGTKAAGGGKDAEAKWKAEQAKRDLERKIEERTRTEIMRALADAGQNTPFVDGRVFWQFLASSLAHLLGGSERELAKRRGLKGDPTKAIFDEIACLAPGGCRSMIVEMLFLLAHDHGEEDLVNELARFYKVDLGAIEKRVEAEITAAATKPPPKASTASTAPSKKGTRPAAKSSTPKSSKPTAKSSSKPSSKKTVKAAPKKPTRK